MNKKFLIPVLSFLFILGVVYGGAKYIGTQKLKQKAQEYLKFSGLEEKIQIGDYDYNPFSGEGVLKNIHVKDLKDKNIQIEKIDRIVLREYKLDDEGKIPLLVDISVYGIKGKSLKKPFLDIDMDVSGLMSYNPKEELLKIEKFNIHFKNFFSIKTSLHLKNISKAVLEEFSDQTSGKNPAVISKILQIKPEYLYFEYREEGLIKKSLEAEAKKRGLSQEQMKEDFLKKIKEIEKKAKTSFEKEILKGVKDIINGGKGKFTLKVKSKNDLTVQEILTSLMIINLTAKDEKEKINQISDLFQKNFDISFHYVKEI